MMNKDLYIGIDPDCDKSGVAFWYKSTKHLEPHTLPFFKLFEKMLNLSLTRRERVLVIIEAGWLHDVVNWHNRPGQSKKAGERIAHDVGRNHQTGLLIVEMCQYLKLDYRLIKPTKKKTTPVLFAKITGIQTKNQEIIDSSMLVFGY